MHCFGMLMDGRAQADRHPQRGEDATLLLVLNAHHDVVVFTLPGAPAAGIGARVRHQCAENQGGEVFGIGDSYAMTGRSTALFGLQK